MVAVAAPKKSALDYARAVRSRAPHSLVISPGRDTPITGDIPLDLPMTVYGRDCEPTALTVNDIF